MDQTFEFTIENAEDVQAIDVIIHDADGSCEIHRLYTAEDKEKRIVIDGGGTEQ